MRYLVICLYTETNKYLSYLYDIQSGEDAQEVYLWTEGNYSCDCNRSLFFLPEEYDINKMMPCGDVAFKLFCIINVDTEKVLYVAKPKEG